MPTSLPPPAPAEAREAPRLPRWHTPALVAFLVAVAIVGALSSMRGAAPKVPGSRALGVYLPILLVNAALALYVSRLGRGQSAFFELVGRRWDKAERALADAALAGIAAAMIVLTESAWAAVFGVPNRASVNELLPATPLERAVWVVVAVTVGTSEELVYRGYLQRELSSLTRNGTLGLVVQAVLFAVAHGEQGAGAVTRALLYGLGFGLLARRRKSLLPGMIAHTGIDLAAGLLRA